MKMDEASFKEVWSGDQAMPADFNSEQQKRRIMVAGIGLTKVSTAKWRKR
jgi:hypothetical protein